MDTEQFIILLKNNDVKQLNDLKKEWKSNIDFKQVFNYCINNQTNDSIHNILGYMYCKRLGVEQSYELAFKYFQLSAKQGNSRAQFNLAYTYKYGEGVEKNYELAFKYYQLSADQGNSDAQNNLATMYDDGKGVEQSYELALKYFQLSANQGESKAQFNLATMYENGKGTKQNYELAFKYYQLSADQGISRAQFNLATMYEDGKGVKQNYDMALKYYQLSANSNQGISRAQNSLNKLISMQPYLLLNIIKNMEENHKKELEEQKLELLKEIYAPGGIGYNIAKKRFDEYK